MLQPYSKVDSIHFSPQHSTYPKMMTIKKNFFKNSLEILANLFYKWLKMKNKNFTVILKHVHFRRTDRLLHPVSSVKRFYNLTGVQWLTLLVPIFNHPSSSTMSQDLSVHLWVISSKRNICAANIHKGNNFVTTKDCSQATPPIWVIWVEGLTQGAD